MASDPTAVTKIYEQIPLQAMQQVSESYMSWYVERVTSELDRTTAGLRSELRENDAKEAGFRPSPNELAAIERLQRSGVTGMDLLDRMVEQGEDWLMLTMRRLDHFERTGLAPKDYSTWCEHALGGAYDWIDHERLATSGSAPAPSGAPARSAANGASAGNSPDWNRSGGAAPRGGYAEESPTAPVPSVSGGGQGWNQNGQGGQQQQGDDDGKGRNIFRIFTN
ncbi:MAG TPA: hypothetical protein VFW17_00210 [Ktedonobacterales bacterium]|jgi:hypothetical protein|nr:hypothetical protein [Ktedonobacterales bacterium]